MGRYANPWSGSSQFYKGKSKRLPTAKTDKDYIAYCSKFKDKSKAMSYEAWVKREYLKYGPRP